MQKLEEGVANPTTKEELGEAIRKYEKRAMDLVASESQEGIWYKILGTRYLDEGMFTKAYECFQKALVFYPANANLYFYVAVCAGKIANSVLDFDATGNISVQERKRNYLKLSEEAYLQALSINPKYYRAMYGLGVLYVFELSQSKDAVPYLERFLETQTKDTNGMFVLARAYYETGEKSKAVQLYDRIIELKPNDEKVAAAEQNKQKVLASNSLN